MTKLFYAFTMVMVFSLMSFAQTNLGNMRWELTHLNGKLVVDSKAHLEFGETEKRITGSTGCNRMFGTYELNRSSFKLNGVGATRMACMPTGAMETESAFLKALGEANAMKRSGRNLTLYKHKARILRFKAAPTNESASDDLTSKKWLLKSIKGELVNLGTQVPFLNFDSEKKSAGGDSGCNVFGGNYALDSTKIKFADIISTMRACEFEDQMTIERGFLDGLQNAERFELKGENLLIYNGETMLLEFEGRVK